MRMWTGVLVLALAAPTVAIPAEPKKVEIAVTEKGFEPARVKVAKGEPVKLVVTRKTDATCAKQILVPDAGLKADLPLDKPVTLTFTPKRAGELKYECEMHMLTGVLDVE